jgi:hypothetical protein
LKTVGCKPGKRVGVRTSNWIKLISNYDWSNIIRLGPSTAVFSFVCSSVFLFFLSLLQAHSLNERNQMMRVIQ